MLYKTWGEKFEYGNNDYKSVITVMTFDYFFSREKFKMSKKILSLVNFYFIKHCLLTFS